MQFYKKNIKQNIITTKRLAILIFIILLIIITGLFVNKYIKNVNIFQPITLKIDGINQNNIKDIEIQSITTKGKIFKLNYSVIDKSWKSNYGFTQYIRIAIESKNLNKIKNIKINIGKFEYFFNKEEFDKYWEIINVNNNSFKIIYQCPENVKGSDSVIFKVISPLLWGGVIRIIYFIILLIICLLIIYYLFNKYKIFYKIRQYKILKYAFSDKINNLNYFSFNFNKTKIKQSLRKIFIIFIGLFITLVLLEISLRVIGYIHLKKRYDYSIMNKKRGDYTILCIGDSFTAGLGARIGKGYPEQLELLLNSKTNKKFRVINRGVSNENTSNILERLTSEINKYKPTLVVLLAGGANQWNLWGYNKSTANKFLYKIRVYKLVKLLYRDIIERRQKVESHNYHTDFNEEESINAIKQFKENIRKDSLNSDNYYNIGNFYLFEKKDTNEAIRLFKKGIKINNNDRKIYDALKYSYSIIGKSTDFLHWIYNEIDKQPANINLWYCLSIVNSSMIEDSSINYLFVKYTKYLNNNGTIDKTLKYPIILYAYNLLKNKDKPFEYAQKELKANKNNLILNYINGIIAENRGGKDDAIKYYNNSIYLYNNIIKKDKSKKIECYKLVFENFYQHDNIFIKLIKKELEYNYDLFQPNKNSKYSNTNLVSGWIKSDLIKIIEICKSLGIKVIMQNYPLHSIAIPELNTNNVIYEIAKENPDLPFIDNRLIFSLLNEPIDNYFEQLGSHPNQNGYGLMAKNLFNKIMEENIFNLDTIQHSKR